MLRRTDVIPDGRQGNDAVLPQVKIDPPDENGELKQKTTSVH
jgi:hypothetical protein